MFAVFAQPIASESETRDGFGRAFASAMEHEGGPSVAIVAVVLTLALVGGVVWWVLREKRREQLERKERDALHEEATAVASTVRQRREWVRVPGRLPMTVKHSQDGQGPWYEDVETQDVSGGGVAFLSHSPPPPGSPLHFTLDLGEKDPLSLNGIVARIETSAPGAPALVALKLGPCKAGVRERIVRWVAQAVEREVVRMRQGRLCESCGRPLADASREFHSTCGPKRKADRARGASLNR